MYLYVCVQLQVLPLFGNGQRLSGKSTLCKSGVFMSYKHRVSSDDVTYN